MLSSAHYREAERLLASDPLDEGHVAAAQVHATLAFVAAFVKNDARWVGTPEPDPDDPWNP